MEGPPQQERAGEVPPWLLWVSAGATNRMVGCDGTILRACGFFRAWAARGFDA